MIHELLVVAVGGVLVVEGEGVEVVGIPLLSLRLGFLLQRVTVLGIGLRFPPRSRLW